MLVKARSFESRKVKSLRNSNSKSYSLGRPLTLGPRPPAKPMIPIFSCENTPSYTPTPQHKFKWDLNGFKCDDGFIVWVYISLILDSTLGDVCRHRSNDVTCWQATLCLKLTIIISGPLYIYCIICEKLFCLLCLLIFKCTFFV